MFEYDRFNFIGPGAAVVQSAITQHPELQTGRKVNFTVQASKVTQQDVTDFTLLASQQPEGLTLTIRNESLRVDETDANGQTTIILQDGQPVAELGVAMEEHPTPPEENKLLTLLRNTAKRFNVPVEDATSEHALAVESNQVLFNGAPEQLMQLPSGAQFISGKVDDVSQGYYVQPDVSRINEDSVFLSDVVANRTSHPDRISVVVATDDPTMVEVPEPLDAISHSDDVSVYIVRPGQAKTSISTANESLRTSWNIKVPSIRRARLRDTQR